MHISFHLGGQVAAIEGDCIATRLLVIGALPIPLGSYYVCGGDVEDAMTAGVVQPIPDLGRLGIRMKKRDARSLTCALLDYVLILLMGAAVVLGLALLMGPPDWRVAWVEHTALTSAAVAVLILLLTRLWGRWVSPRDRAIRAGCSEWLGIAADPASADTEAATACARFADACLSEHGVEDWKRPLAALERLPGEVASLLLVRVRAAAATADRDEDRRTVEEQTNFLLDLIEGYE